MLQNRMTFKQFAGPLLEMPYFIYDKNGIAAMYDFRIEQMTFEEFENLLLILFSGNPTPPDKDGRVLQISESSLKQEVLDYMFDKREPFMLNVMVKYNTKINPVIRSGRMPTATRTPEEIKAYENWILGLLEKSKTVS